jgi:glycosyltransferase involved in cell wall biosynthesis
MDRNAFTSSADPATSTCLINSFNYASYVGEAVDSALGQTVPFDEIIVVDDGSTDGSLKLLKDKYSQASTVKIIAKSNEGQLSCFNEGFAQARGDLIFFLDADDIYEPDYHSLALNEYRRDPQCDFLACSLRQFGQADKVLHRFPDDRDLGYSVILTAFKRSWIGQSTSCLSMRRQILNKILPLPLVEDWRVRADDCLVYGSSLVGARKRYVAKPLVRYRVHGRNGFFGQKADWAADYRHQMAINRLCGHLMEKYQYEVARLAESCHFEFCTIERPTRVQLMRYSRICMGAETSLVRRLSSILKMFDYYRQGKKRSKGNTLKITTLAGNQRRRAA